MDCRGLWKIATLSQPLTLSHAWMCALARVWESWKGWPRAAIRDLEIPRVPTVPTVKNIRTSMNFTFCSPKITFRTWERCFFGQESVLAKSMDFSITHHIFYHPSIIHHPSWVSWKIPPDGHGRFPSLKRWARDSGDQFVEWFLSIQRVISMSVCGSLFRVWKEWFSKRVVYCIQKVNRYTVVRT